MRGGRLSRVAVTQDPETIAPTALLLTTDNERTTLAHPERSSHGALLKILLLRF